jgi:hypothetical protein
MNAVITGEHRIGLGLIALKRLDHQREPGGIGQQPHGDLRLQATFLGEPRLPEPVPGTGLEIQGRHVIQHQRRRPQRRMRGAGRGEPAAPGVAGVGRQATVEGGIRHRVHAGFFQHPKRVLLAGRLDDPR